MEENETASSQPRPPANESERLLLTVLRAETDELQAGILLDRADMAAERANLTFDRQRAAKYLQQLAADDVVSRDVSRVIAGGGTVYRLRDEFRTES